MVRPCVVGAIRVDQVACVGIHSMVVESRRHLRRFAGRAAKHGRSQRTPQGKQQNENQQNENAKRLHSRKVNRQ